MCPAIVLDPKNVELLWERASLYCKIGDSKKAIEYFEQTLKVWLAIKSCVPKEGIASFPLQVLPPEARKEFVEINKELATVS